MPGDNYVYMAIIRPHTEGQTKALIVEDDDSVRRSVVKLLDRNGYTCEPAAAATEALQLLDEEEFDLVLTNMDMPGGAGLDLLMHIAAAHPDVATVVVTEKDDARIARAAPAGM